MTDARNPEGLRYINRILIVRLGSLGDIVHALPAAAALRRALPDAGSTGVVDERHGSCWISCRSWTGVSSGGPARYRPGVVLPG